MVQYAILLLLYVPYNLKSIFIFLFSLSCCTIDTLAVLIVVVLVHLFIVYVRLL